MKRGSFSLGTISLGRVEVPYPKIVINIPRTNEKLHCIGEPYWFSGWRDSLVQTDRHIYKDPLTFLRVGLKINKSLVNICHLDFNAYLVLALTGLPWAGG